MINKSFFLLTTSVQSVLLSSHFIDVYNMKFISKLQTISSLNFELSCAVENSRADLGMEQERNKALNERITYLGL